MLETMPTHMHRHRRLGKHRRQLSIEDYRLGKHTYRHKRLKDCAVLA